MKALNLEQMGETAIANQGNTYRIKQVMKRAMAGEHLTLGFLGGSITQGSLATKPELCYAYLVYEWWVKKFPNATFEFVNAGVGGTTSHYATARVNEHLLNKNPDFAIVEFSVNDDADEHFKETYESVIRKVYGAENKPATLIVNNVYYNDGHNAQEEHVEVGKYYQIPCVSIKDSVYQEVLAGNIERREITPDDLHPNDAGHQLLCDMITHFLEKVYKDIDREETEVIMPVKALTRNHYAIARRYQCHNSNPVLEGFAKDERKPEAVYDNFKCGWTARNVGDKITLEVTGTEIAVQYCKTIHRPAPIARVILDGDVEHAVTLDANFNEDWGDCLFIQRLGKNLDSDTHKVEVEIVTVPEGCISDFYLVSIITGQKEE